MTSLSISLSFFSQAKCYFVNEISKRTTIKWCSWWHFLWFVWPQAGCVRNGSMIMMVTSISSVPRVSPSPAWSASTATTTRTGCGPLSAPPWSTATSHAPGQATSTTTTRWPSWNYTVLYLTENQCNHVTIRLVDWVPPNFRTETEYFWGSCAPIKCSQIFFLSDT